ncbi:hypothetical protein ACJJTC_017132 [Scirpophaga incertulas]
MPKVITEMKCEDNTDYIVDILIHKHQWQKKNDGLKPHLAKSVRTNLEHHNDEVLECPMYLIEMAAQLENDPDPNFKSTYNWYYSGNGNMQIICMQSVDYVLHSDFNTVYLSRFHKGNSSMDSNPTASFSCEEDMNILETIYSKQNIIALRTKPRIYIMKIIESKNDLQFELLKELDTKSTFTSISFDNVHTNILYVTTLDNNLTIVNIDRMTGKTVKLCHHSESLLNNWHTVTGVGRGSYMFIEKNAITLYDKRTHTPTTSWKGLKGIVDLVYCNDITSAKACEENSSLYFTTDHHLFLMDTRACSTDLKVVQRWFHGLQCAPTYMTVEKMGYNREFIVISSQWCEDTCVISTYADTVVNLGSPSVCMPYHLPNVFDALKTAREQMLCFDIQNPIDGRLAMSTSGLAIFNNDNNLSVLTHNVLGDIFQRTLYPKYMKSFIEDNSIQVLHEWSKSYKIERGLFEISSITNIADVWRKLQTVPKSYEFGPKNAEVVIDETEMYKAYENQELIPELLDAWVIELRKKSHHCLKLIYQDSDN